MQRFAATTFTLVLLACAPSAGAACRAESTAERAHLVELYTSEGCSSCPPADAWLASLRAERGWVALEYHVDYWDTRDFRDPYADARHAARQRALARAQRVNVVTPQVVLDGRAWKNWPKGTPPEFPAADAPPLSLVARVDGERVQVDVDTPAAADRQAFVVLTEDGLTNTVAAGENRGRTLTHEHVVRAFAGPFPAGRFDAGLALDGAVKTEAANVVAFATDGDGRVLQVVRLPLAGCAP